MQAKKVTVVLPADLLKRARRSTGEGVTRTIRRGLELVAAESVYDRLLALRGRARVSLNLDKLREDRR